MKKEQPLERKSTRTLALANATGHPVTPQQGKVQLLLAVTLGSLLQQICSTAEQGTPVQAATTCKTPNGC